MITRLLWASLRRRGAQLGLIFLATAVAAGTCAALAAFASLSRARLARDLARFGPNLLVRAAAGGPPRLDREAVQAVLAVPGVLSASGVVLLDAAENGSDLTVVGSDAAITALHPNWRIEPRWPAAGERARGAALPPAAGLGRIETGEPELDRSLFVALDDPLVAGLGFDRVEVRTAAGSVDEVAKAVEARLAGAEARPLRRVSESDARTASRIEWLLAAAGALTLALALSAVVAATAALVVERRNELALMLALGHPASRLLALLASELLAAAFLAALIGAAMGEIGAVAMARRVLGEAGVAAPWSAGGAASTAAVLIALAGVAAAVRGVARLDPSTILRGE